MGFELLTCSREIYTNWERCVCLSGANFKTLRKERELPWKINDYFKNHMRVQCKDARKSNSGSLKFWLPPQSISSQIFGI